MTSCISELCFKGCLSSPVVKWSFTNKHGKYVLILYTLDLCIYSNPIFHTSSWKHSHFCTDKSGFSRGIAKEVQGNAIAPGNKL